MSPRRAAVRRSPRAADRRRLVWAQSFGNIPMTANNQWFPLDLLSQFKAISGEATEGITVMRTHLTVCPQAPAATDTWWVGLRIADIDDTTGAVSTSANIANPKDQPYVDWMFARQMVNDGNENAGASIGGAYTGLVLDLKSKRRMHQLQQTYSLVLVQQAVGTVAKNYAYFARMLLALP